ncbi:MAG: hypothetical protein ACK6AH_08660 [Gemmatimonadota bacterium]
MLSHEHRQALGDRDIDLAGGSSAHDRSERLRGRWRVDDVGQFDFGDDARRTGDARQPQRCRRGVAIHRRGAESRQYFEHIRRRRGLTDSARQFVGVPRGWIARSCRSLVALGEPAGGVSFGAT